jgi:hypothetical protein
MIKTTTVYPFLVVYVACAVGGLFNKCSGMNKPGQQTTTLQQSGPKSNDSHSQVDVDEYSVYSVVLSDDRYIDANTKQVVIKNHTAPGFTVEGLQNSMPSLSRVTIDDYESKSKSISLLKAELGLKVKYKLITDEEVDNIFRRGGPAWEVFHSKFPGSKGLIGLSRVGFNSDRTQALVHVGFGCDWNCGDSQLIFLRKDKNAWRIEGKVLTSVS